MLPHAPEELTHTTLRRIGEGIGRVVYASENWVVKRQRSPSAVLALILVWKALRRVERALPGRAAAGWIARPSRQLRFLRVLVQGVVSLVPRPWWSMTHAGQILQQYRYRDARGEKLAAAYLTGSGLVPETVQFPPTVVKVGGWPGYLTVEEATERVACTLDQKLRECAHRGDYDAVERWLHRLLSLRLSGWSRGLFSVDAHLKNYGVTGDRIVLLDSGGLTANWSEVERRLAWESTVESPHAELGLEDLLSPRPDIAARFDERWRELLTEAGVRRHWPSATPPGGRPA